MEDQQKSLRPIFNEAIELESADQRAAYLQRVCGDNASLRQPIEN